MSQPRYMIDRSPLDAYEAYVAGLIASDGCIHRRKGVPRGIALDLSARDCDVLFSIAQKYGRPMPYTHTPDKGGPAVWLSLLNFPITWKTAPPRDLEQPLLRHYVRGLVDGDGSLYWLRCRGYTYPALEFNVNKAEEWLLHFFETWLDGWENVDYSVYEKSSTWVVRPTKWQDCAELAGHLYRDPSFCIARKRQLADEFTTFWSRKNMVEV